MNDESAVPSITYCYRNHSIDSERWSLYSPRDGDVIVTSSYKSGTTWMQLMVLRLLNPDVEYPPIARVSPWLESPLSRLDQVLATLDRRDGRRVLKTHLPLDGLPYYPNVRYVVVGRDPRDVFMSLWNHYRHLILDPYFTDAAHPERIGAPLPPCPHDVTQFWRQWMTRGWFEWENDGYPFWSNLRHTQSWWSWRHLTNIAFFHFNDLLDDRRFELRELAVHLGVSPDPAALEALARAVDFSNMQRHACDLLPEAEVFLQGGPCRFLFRGTNGRWRGVLADDDLALCETALRREMSADCARWIQGGRRA